MFPNLPDCYLHICLLLQDFQEQASHAAMGMKKADLQV